MIYFTSTLLNIIVYIVTFAVMWRIFRKRETDLETEYRLNYARMCTTFIDTMQTVSKALDADGPEPEQPTLGEWAETLCKATGCEFIADNGCKRTDEDYDGTCPCDIERQTEE